MPASRSAEEMTELGSRIDILTQHIGEEVTIIPHRGVGESRDTEPGLQPWEATLEGVDANGCPIVRQGDYEARTLRHTDFRILANGQIQFGSW